MISQQVEQFMK